MQRSCFNGAVYARIKPLYDKRKMLSILSFIFSMFGIGLMIVEIEISSRLYLEGFRGLSWKCYLIKVVVSFSTIFLVITLILYHQVCIQLFMVENGVHNWRLVLNFKWTMMICLEILVCLIHPVPLQNSKYIWTTYRINQNKTELELVPINVILTILMFLRGYLIIRVMVLHCYIYDTSVHSSLDTAQRRNINTQFAIKYLLTVYSKSFLLCSVLFLFIWTCWGVRVCENYENNNEFKFFGNLWFIGVTFLTVGYGDIVPNTVCGRFVAIMAGTFGVICTAYVVAIIAESMQLSYSETYLHQFVIKNELNRDMKESAASIFQNLWRIKQEKKVQGIKDENKHILQCRINLRQHSHQLKVLKDENIELEKKSLNISTLYGGQLQIYNEIDKLSSQINKLELLTSNIALALNEQK